MENLKVDSIDCINDINTRDEYQVALDAGLSPEEAIKTVNRFSRDNARTPFQWSAEENAGFTTGKPWLFVNPNYTEINVNEQLGRKESVLNHYKKLIMLRKNKEYKDTIVYGEVVPVMADVQNLMAYYRMGEKQTLLVLANFQKEERTVTLEMPYKRVLLDNYGQEQWYDNITDKKNILLKEYQAVILEM